MASGDEVGTWPTFESAMRKKVAFHVARIMRSEHGMKHYPPERAEQFFDRYVAGMSTVEFGPAEQQILIEIGSSTKPHSIFPANGHSFSSRSAVDEKAVGLTGFKSPVPPPAVQQEEPEVGPEVGRAAMTPAAVPPPPAEPVAPPPPALPSEPTRIWDARPKRVLPPVQPNVGFRTERQDPEPRFGGMLAADGFLDLSSHPDPEGISEPVSSPKPGGAQPEAGQGSTGGVAAPALIEWHGPAELKGDDAEALEELLVLERESRDLVSRAKAVTYSHVEANLAQAVALSTRAKALSEAAYRHAEGRALNEQGESLRSRAAGRVQEEADASLYWRPQTSPAPKGTSAEADPQTLRAGQRPDETTPRGEARKWQSPEVSRPSPEFSGGGLNPPGRYASSVIGLALVIMAYCVIIASLEIGGVVSWPSVFGPVTMTALTAIGSVIVVSASLVM
ncbi:MAG: hypothetical protein WCB19_05805 [Thermoplasmata archaeon]